MSSSKPPSTNGYPSPPTSLSASAYRQAHQGEGYPANIIRQYIQEHGLPDEGGIATLATQLKLPESTLRSTLSYYADFSVSADTGNKICDGTSCFLSRQDASRSPTQATQASCLGHCYRENNSLEHGNIHCADKDAGKDTEAAIHCLATEPVTTRNLLDQNPDRTSSSPDKARYDALRSALEQTPENVIETITASGLRGRGGAAFPTGVKWQACARTPAEQRYVIANGNEGDPGSYIDRVLLEQDPHSIIEGVLLCGYAIGASKGIVFIRSEYPQAASMMERAIDEARDAGVFAAGDFNFDLTVIHGAGSFVCGEETALINAIEGLRGEVRLRPPYPTQAGLFGKPTVVDNVETLANIPYIMARGAESYASMGTSASPGTKTLCFNHGFTKPGIVEVEFGTPLQAAIDAVGGGKEPLAAILLGGPMGCVLTPDRWDTPVCYEAMHKRGLDLGHGSMIALPESADKADLLRHWLGFMRQESCGKCAPCSLGSEQSRRIVSQPLTTASHDELRELLHLIGQTSLCSFGKEIPRAVSQYMKIFQSEMIPPKSS